MASTSIPPDTRSRVVAEIVSTERTFVSNLKTLIDVYIDPLRAKGILSPQEVALLFRNWELLVSQSDRRQS